MIVIMNKVQLTFTHTLETMQQNQLQLKVIYGSNFYKRN